MKRRTARRRAALRRTRPVRGIGIEREPWEKKKK